MAKKKTIKDVEAEEKVTEIEETEKECSCGCGCDETCDCGCQEGKECHCHDEKLEEKKAKKEEKKKEEKKSNKKDGYFKLIGKELKKVVWPSAGEVAKYSLAVILFCVILVLFFVGIDALASFIKGLF